MAFFIVIVEEVPTFSLARIQCPRPHLRLLPLAIGAFAFSDPLQKSILLDSTVPRLKGVAFKANFSLAEFA